MFYALSRDDWLGGVLAGITVAMGVLPEEFPVVLTVFLAMGAWRISRAGVLTRRMPAVESIGAATVLAVDKTGTLTENRMRLALVETPDGCFDLRSERTSLSMQHAETFWRPPSRRANATRSIRWSAPSTRRRNASIPRRAHELREAGARARVRPHCRNCWRSRMSGGIRTRTQLRGRGRRARRKPCSICVASISRSGPTCCNASLRMRSEGLRVLGVAQGSFGDAVDASSRRASSICSLLGFVCLADPLRGDVPAALAECAQAGIRVVMITGDHPGTALAIAAQAGFDTRGGALTGAELEALDGRGAASRVRAR